MSSLVLPRLSRTVARLLVGSFADQPLRDLADGAAEDHADAAYPPLGGRRISVGQLATLREQLVEVATAVGYPDSDDSAARRTFDVRAAAVLHQALPLSPRVAADGDTWSFVCCVLCPDLVAWRFPNRNTERYLGGMRNTLQRLWLRAAVLHDSEADQSYHLLEALPEDALVQIFERPGVWADWNLAQLLADELVSSRAASSERFNFQQLVRTTLMRVRQILPFANLTALEKDAQRRVVRDLVTASMPGADDF